MSFLNIFFLVFNKLQRNHIYLKNRFNCDKTVITAVSDLSLLFPKLINFASLAFHNAPNGPGITPAGQININILESLFNTFGKISIP